jgi:hypothetical protein
LKYKNILLIMIILGLLVGCKPPPGEVSSSQQTLPKVVTKWKVTWWDGTAQQTWTVEKEPDCYHEGGACSFYVKPTDQNKTWVQGTYKVEPQ